MLRRAVHAPSQAAGAQRERTERAMALEPCGAGGDGYSGSVADFAHLFCDAPTALMVLCEFILNTAPPGTITDEVRGGMRWRG